MLLVPRMSPTHRIARTPAELTEMVAAVSQRPTVGFDFETNGLRFGNGRRPIGYSIGFLDKRVPWAWYVPFAHMTAEPQAHPDAARAALCDALRHAPDIVAHNFKFDLNHGRAWAPGAIPEASLVHDSMIQGYFIDENRQFALEQMSADERTSPYGDPFEMKNLVTDYCAARARDRRMPIKKAKDGRPCYMESFGHAEVPVGLEGEYSCRDIGHTLLLDAKLRPLVLAANTPLAARREYLYRTEMMLVRALADMEWRGQRVDVGYLRRFALELDDELDTKRVELRRLFGIELDWGNDTDVRALLYDGLKLPVLKRTDSKAPSIDRGALLMLQSQQRDTSGRWGPALAALADYKQHETVRQGFTTSLADATDADGRVRSNFKQTGTGPGRLSSEAPNLQNIPIRHPGLAKRIRRAFMVDPDVGGRPRARVFSDYSQVELRVLGHVCRARTFVEAYSSPAYDGFLRGDYDYNEYRRRRRSEPSVDIHAAQAKRAFGVAETHPEWKNKRRAAKVINFGVPYGMGPKGMAENPELMIPDKEARAYFATYHRNNPEIAETQQALFRKMLGCAGAPAFTNWIGYTRHVPGLRSGNEWAVSAAEREAFASLVQGGAAFLTRISIVRLYVDAREGLIPANATSTVHDEIQVDCDLADVPVVAAHVQQRMEDFHGHFGKIPIIADLEVTATDWASKEHYDPAV